MSVQGPNAMDFSGFAALRARAADNDPQVLREVARQFESLFTGMMLKNMRAASLGDPLMGSSEQDGYRDMFDQQMAVEMSRGRGLGIADMLVRQLSGTVASAIQGEPAARASGLPLDKGTGSVFAVEAARGAPKQGAVSREDFVASLWPHAQNAGKELGVDPRVIVAQAALETGWGRMMPVDHRGQSSNNFFGIKAGNDWQGPAVTTETLEFAGGALRKERAAFRAYSSPAHSVQNYVEFLTSNPRYGKMLSDAKDPQSFAEGLQTAGYATDPEYASKLMAVMRSEPISKLTGGLKFSANVPIHTADAAIRRPGTGPTGPVPPKQLRS